MSAFRDALAAVNPSPAGRRWLFVPYDQLTDGVGPLARERPEELGIVVVENPWKAAQRPYHRQKLALVLANLRHFALEQAGRGVAVRHVVARGPYREALRPLLSELGSMRVMEPAERELRQDLGDLLEVVPHEGWLSTPEQFRASQSGPPWRMDVFYRFLRRVTGVLMDQGRPRGGKWSYDPENRLPWKGKPAPPVPPTFPLDPIKAEVGELVERRFERHPGRLNLATLPSTRADAETAWSWAARECLPLFGPYEDAMTVHSTGLFHSRLSPLINLHRLLPRTLVEATAARTDLPLPSQEGFVRQILGWREFVRHVHRETDGFRTLGESLAAPGDGGYSGWAGAPWQGMTPSAPGGALAKGGMPLPPAWWGQPSGLHCLDTVVRDVWEEGWSHHITRLMVLGNLATLLDVSGRELTDWFWVAYIDAFDWVVEPNVLGMATWSSRGVMTTKPYISGAAYINRMSDYCTGCAFDPKGNCPVTNLYWAWLGRHPELAANPRMGVVMRALEKRSPAQRARDAEVFEETRERLRRGESLLPGAVDEPGEQGY